MSNKTNNVPDLNIAHDENGNPIWGGGSADLFSDRNLDEMQRAYSHKIAFRCFKFLFWFCFILSFALFFAYIETGHIFVLICSYVALGCKRGAKLKGNRKTQLINIALCFGGRSYIEAFHVMLLGCRLTHNDFPDLCTTLHRHHPKDAWSALLYTLRECRPSAYHFSLLLVLLTYLLSF